MFRPAWPTSGNTKYNSLGSFIAADNKISAVNDGLLQHSLLIVTTGCTE